MKLEGTYQFYAPQAAVWAALQDIQQLQAIIPDCELESIGDNGMTNTINLRSMHTKLGGSFTLSEVNEPKSCQFMVTLNSASGALTGNGEVLLEMADGMTTLLYTAELEASGELAELDPIEIVVSLEEFIEQGLTALAKQLPPQPTTTENASYRPEVPSASGTPPESPSQVEFATGVAHNIVDDLVPTEHRTLVLATVGGGIGVILFAWWLSRRSDSSSSSQRLSQLGGQLEGIRQNQIRPLVAEMSYQLAALEQHQVRPFINSIAEQLAELDASQVQPFIEELSQQIADLSENKLRPLIHELSDQMVAFSNRQTEQGVDAVKAGMTIGALLAGVAGLAWWFMNREDSAD